MDNVVKAILVVAIPFVAFAGGGYVMGALSDRDYLTDRFSHLPKQDQKGIGLRVRGYNLEAVVRHWGALDKDSRGLDAQRLGLEIDLLFPFLYGGTLALSLIEYYWLMDLGFRSATINMAAQYKAVNDFKSLNELLGTGVLYASLAASLVFIVAMLLAPLAAHVWSVSQPEFPILIRMVAASWSLGLVFTILSSCLEGFQRKKIGPSAITRAGAPSLRDARETACCQARRRKGENPVSSGAYA